MTKLPFIVIDLLFLSLAAWIIYRSGPIVHVVDSLPLILCVAGGAGFLAYPFIMDYHAALKLAESDNLTSTVQQIQNIESVAAQISTATGHWQSALDQSNKTVTAANEIATRMNSEAQAFAEFMQKANDAEKGRLRLEVDKLRRAESQWLQILVHMLDHVYDLYQAAVRSGQPNIIQQLGQFQNACRDVARRIGLIPFGAEPGEAFDSARHQLLDEKSEIPAGAIVGQGLATGYTFQGQLVRRAVVALQMPAPAAPAEAPVSVSLVPEGNPQEQQLL